MPTTGREPLVNVYNAYKSRLDLADLVYHVVPKDEVSIDVVLGYPPTPEVFNAHVQITQPFMPPNLPPQIKCTSLLIQPQTQNGIPSFSQPSFDLVVWTLEYEYKNKISCESLVSNSKCYLFRNIPTL
jgi:hypothetical protein